MSIGMPLLLADLYAFYLEHQRCGELEAPEGDPDWVVMTCTCGAKIARRIEDPSPRSLSSRLGFADVALNQRIQDSSPYSRSLAAPLRTSRRHALTFR